MERPRLRATGRRRIEARWKPQAALRAEPGAPVGATTPGEGVTSAMQWGPQGDRSTGARRGGGEERSRLQLPTGQRRRTAQGDACPPGRELAGARHPRSGSPHLRIRGGPKGLPPAAGSVSSPLRRHGGRRAVTDAAWVSRGSGSQQTPLAFPPRLPQRTPRGWPAGGWRPAAAEHRAQAAREEV